MVLEKGIANGVFRVRVDAGEVVTDSGKTVPYATWIGTVSVTGEVRLWRPAGYLPRDYRPTAERMLSEALKLIPRE